jgi:hypothetical protein
MKTFALSLVLLASASASSASTLPEQDACLESAAATMASAKVDAQKALDVALAKCRTMPNVDVVNECVNDAFLVFEKATQDAFKAYEAEIQFCL